MKICSERPTEIPVTSVLNKLYIPAEIKNLASIELKTLVDDVRAHMLYSVGQSGGHLGGGLGVVELTVALQYLYNTPEDKIIWDVGHQAYSHKILTGRKDKFSSNRQLGGISGFPKRSESIYDTFGTGHASTSISAALGMAIASSLNGLDTHHIAVIGDASIAGCLAFEGLNHD